MNHKSSIYHVGPCLSIVHGYVGRRRELQGGERRCTGPTKRAQFYDDHEMTGIVMPSVSHGFVCGIWYLVPTMFFFFDKPRFFVSRPGDLYNLVQPKMEGTKTRKMDV